MLKLNDFAKNSELYMQLTSHLMARLNSLRVRLEYSQPELQTEKIRGKIEELKGLLKLLEVTIDADS